MTTRKRQSSAKPKFFAVTYCVEQGYTITVQASSPEDAERVAKQRLDDEMDVLDGSNRMHHWHDTVGSEEVQS